MRRKVGNPSNVSEGRLPPLARFFRIFYAEETRTSRTWALAATEQRGDTDARVGYPVFSSLADGTRCSFVTLPRATPRRAAASCDLLFFTVYLLWNHN